MSALLNRLQQIAGSTKCYFGDHVGRQAQFGDEELERYIAELQALESMLVTQRRALKERTDAFLAVSDQIRAMTQAMGLPDD